MSQLYCYLYTRAIPKVLFLDLYEKKVFCCLFVCRYNWMFNAFLCNFVRFELVKALRWPRAVGGAISCQRSASQRCLTIESKSCYLVHSGSIKVAVLLLACIPGEIIIDVFSDSTKILTLPFSRSSLNEVFQTVHDCSLMSIVVSI